MKIITQRGQVITGDYLRQKVGRLVSNTVEGIAMGQADISASASPNALRAQAETAAREAGLDPGSKAGQAAAGAALIADTIAQAVRQYEIKSGKPAPRHVILALQSRFLKLLGAVSSEGEEESAEGGEALSQALKSKLGQRSSVELSPKRGEVRSIHPDNLEQKPPAEG